MRALDVLLDRPPWAASRDVTVLHVTHPKAGSQWVLAVLRQLQPARVEPPAPAAAHVLGARLRPGHIYPTVYLGRDALERLELPTPHRIFAVVRDPRDTLVSYYFSMRYSHPLMSPHVARERERLSAMDERGGLAATLEGQSLRRFVQIQLSWLHAGVPVLRYENLLADELAGFTRIAEHCMLPVGPRALRRAVARCSFERQAGRPRGREDVHSHLRRATVGDWRNHLDAGLQRRFRELYGAALIETGYEKDDAW